jgi:DNA-binding CsgD family transcriptional regulator
MHNRIERSESDAGRSADIMDDHGVATLAAPCCCQLAHLTEREATVLCLVAAGLSTAEISSRLHLSTHTIDRHLGNMLRRSGAQNRAALVARAYHAGVLIIGSWPPSQSGRRCLRVLPRVPGQGELADAAHGRRTTLTGSGA